MAAFESRRKRPLELECDDGEKDDEFDTYNSCAPRRGAKAARRVSGVIKEIKDLQNIGVNPMVLQLVFKTLKWKLKEVMVTGTINSTWYTVACSELRSRYGDSPILRLWNTERRPYLFSGFELHFHEQLLAGDEDDEPMDGWKRGKQFNFPKIDSIISVGSKGFYQQLIHEDAKLPFREDHIYFECSDVFITKPDFSYTGNADEEFGWSTITVQSLLLPRSKHISFKAFGLESSVGEWDIEKVKAKIEFPAEDIGVGQELKGVFCIFWSDQVPSMSFLDIVKTHYTVGLLSGFTEELGFNKSGSMSPTAVGLAIYAGPGAVVSMFEIDFEQEDTSERVLIQIEKQAKSYKNGFGFVMIQDTRDWVEVPDPDANDIEDWSSSTPPPSRDMEIIAALRERMPRTPLLGIRSFDPLTVRTEPANTNVGSTGKKLCVGLLLVSYDNSMEK